MIPHTLILRNFICYREASLDFGGFRVACLSGPNGAGKSALLDAMTWALWGRSRARRDDELIYLGESEMSVEFTFGLGGQAYRVLRRRKAGKRGSSLLDFQIEDALEWRSIAENTIRHTQEKIERTLRLDYATFVNSAFLRQGQADEFTVKTAAERKRVLGEILGLDRWAEYEERAKEQQASLRAEIGLLELRLDEIDGEVARRSDYERDLADAEARLAELDSEIQAAEASHQRIEVARSELRHAEDQVADLARRISQADDEIGRLDHQIAAAERSVAEIRQLLSDAEAIAAGYDNYLAAVERERALGAKLLQSVELSSRRAELENGIAAARLELEKRRDVFAARIADLERRVPSPALLDERDSVRAQVAHLSHMAESRDAAQKDLGAISETRAALRVENETLRKDMLALRQRIDQVKEAEAACPLCEQPLGEDHRQALLDQFEAEGTNLGDRFRTNRARDGELREQAQALQLQVGEVARLVEPLPALQRREAALAERIESGERARDDLDRARADLAPVVEVLKSGQFAGELRAELAEVLSAAADLGYDHDAHQRATEELADLAHFAERRAHLASAEDRLAQAEETSRRLAVASQDWSSRREAEERSRSDYEARASALGQELAGAPDVAAELDRVRRLEAAVRHDIGASRQRLEACRALDQQRQDRAARLQSLRLDLSVCEELRTAFGVKGVPAMIIEAAVPEIETEANRLLARMTAGRMHVRFDTQRETQAGDIRETLEIAISDELGTRPYEAYSGGEQFRVNFAIRIALSRLLARRAGARLETLVIDEGFGTQDAEGRQRLIEAISVVRDDFARILVITHIEELRDAFPARIEVRKTPDGSVLEVV